MKYSLAFSCILLWTSTSFAQRLQTPALSPLSKSTQEVGLTTIGLEYARPSAKGRTVFGELVPYGEIWRTGANASTKITLTEPAHIGGNTIAAGTYALYTIPGADVWTIIIHSNTKMRSLAGNVYKEADDVFRFEVKPQAIEPYVETFTLQFTDLTTNSVNLQLSWANTMVNIPIAVNVDEKIDAQMAEFLKTPGNIPDRTYFEAAQYYLNNEKDLGTALGWIEDALTKSPENARYGLLKAKIQYAMGDQKAALTTVNLAHDWAVKSNNANYVGQTDLYRKSISGGN